MVFVSLFCHDVIHFIWILSCQDKERIKELCSQVVQDSERVEIQERDQRLAQMESGLQKKKEHLALMQKNMATIEQFIDSASTMVATLQDIQQEYNKDKLVSQVVQ